MKEAYVGGGNFENKELLERLENLPIPNEKNKKRLVEALKNFRDKLGNIVENGADKVFYNVIRLLEKGKTIEEIINSLPNNVQGIAKRLLITSPAEKTLEVSEVDKANSELTKEHRETLKEIEAKLPEDVKNKIDKSSSSILKKVLKIIGYGGVAVILAYLGYLCIPGMEGVGASFLNWVADSTLVESLKAWIATSGADAALITDSYEALKGL